MATPGRSGMTAPATGTLDTDRRVGPDGPPPGVRPRGWWFDAVLLAGFAGITVALLASPALRALDVATRDWCDRHRPPAAGAISFVLNHLGNTPIAVLTLLIALFLVWRRRTARPLLPVIAAQVLALLTVGPLKILTERGAPHYGSVKLFSEPQQQSYPSGHLVNTILWFGVIATLLSPWLPTWLRRVIRVLPVAVVGVTTVYLGYHWLTDTIAGLLLGLFLHRVMARIPFSRIPLPRALDRERREP